MLSYVSRSSVQTEVMGQILGDTLQVGDTVLLEGTLGSGKTTFARGIAQGAGCAVSARSPTFIIVAEYPGTPSIFHCDLYRLTSLEDINELGLEENLARGALVVEWPENACGALPKDAIHVGLTLDPADANLRQLTFRAVGDSAASTLSRVHPKLREASQGVGEQCLGNIRSSVPEVDCSIDRSN